MKKLLSLLLFAAFAMVSKADNVPGLTVLLTSGTTKEFALSDIQNITYSDDAMVVALADNSSQSISIDDITKMTLGSISITPTSIDNASSANTKEANLLYNIGKLLFVEKDGKTIKVKK